VIGHLAGEGRLGDVASLTLLVTALDNERASRELRRPPDPVGERLSRHAAAGRGIALRALHRHPPGEQSRASYRVAAACPADLQPWLASAAMLPGSWWTDYAAWLGELAPAPSGRRGRTIAKAPGTYVHAS
jgi:hypothetical protein